MKKYNKKNLWKNNKISYKECNTYILEDDGIFMTSRIVRKNMKYYVPGCEEHIFSLKFLKRKRYKNT